MISFKSKKGLGRGLSSLIGEGKVSSNTKANISELRRNKYQPRKKFDETSLNELSDSIKSRGIIQPIIVRNSNSDSKYEIIAGERRWRALKHLKKRTVPAYVLDTKNSSDIMEMALVENIQREDLNSIEESEAYAILNKK